MAANRVIHQIFADCVGYTTDPYWKEILNQFACNRFPSDLKYDSTHHNFVLKEGKKNVAIPLEDDNPPEAFKTTMRVLKDKLGMRSTRDLKIQKDKMEDAMQKRVTDLDCEWKKIKPRHLKDQLLMDYIMTLKEKHELTNTEVKNLISVVQLGMQFRSLTSDDVEYVGGVVVNITGLEFDDEARIFVTRECKNTNLKSEKPTPPNKFYSGFDKFVRDNTVRLSKIS